MQNVTYVGRSDSAMVKVSDPAVALVCLVNLSHDSIEMDSLIRTDNRIQIVEKRISTSLSVIHKT
jgi:hypothetical protein